jgi:glycosyltransferase involved in cell wall biosynthesis
MQAVPVSVVIPAYQAASSLEETLESVAGQTYQDFEVVVVDDGSTDGTGAVARALIERLGLTRARVIARPTGRERHSNAGLARNAGVDVATGEHVAFLDADDVWRPAKLERVMARFAADRELVAVCHDELIVRDGRPAGVYRCGTRLPLYWRLLLVDNCLSPSGTVARIDAVRGAGGFSPYPAHNSVEDYWLWLRLARRGRFEFIHEVLGEYRIDSGGLSRNADLQVSAKLAVIDEAFDREFGQSRSGWRWALRRQRRMRAIQDVAWECRLEGDIDHARRLARRALEEWPASPKLWMVAGAIALRAARAR